MKKAIGISLTVITALALLSGPAGGQDITEGKPLLSDDFSRLTESKLGQLPEGGQSWGKRVPVKDGVPMDTAIHGSGGGLVIGYASGVAPSDCGVYVANFTVADAVISVTVGPSHMNDRCNNGIVSYRAAATDAAAGGWQPRAYHVHLTNDWSGSRDVTLRYGGDVLAVGDVADQRVLTDSHQVKVAFAGDHHQVWLNGRKVIDYWEIDAGRKGAGYLGFGGVGTIGVFDDFKVSEARPGAAVPPANAGGIGPLVLQGRPFFAFGTYNLPDQLGEGIEDLQEWLDAGCNTAAINPPTNEAEAKARFHWLARHGVAAIYLPGEIFYSQLDDKLTVTRPEEIPAKAAPLKKMLALTADDPHTFGYCTFDEPENVLYQTYQHLRSLDSWDQKHNPGLARWIADGMKWTYDTLKTGDPDAYVMPIIGWWNTYKDMAPLYDVNVTNHYPTLWDHSDAPLQGKLYEVVLDAALAADAVRATGRVGFIYMPGMFDLIDRSSMGPISPTTPTLRELRYTCFAPITQGALGVLPWRLGYCSRPYRRTVVYPIMRELSRMRPWFLGEWCDGKVTSNRDKATAGYLRKLPRLVREVYGEEEAEMVETDAVPDVSHCLRRRPDNTYLLLAVNNRKEIVQVTFTLKDIPGLPETALELIEYAGVPIIKPKDSRRPDGQIRDKLEPFGVRAYLIKPK